MLYSVDGSTWVEHPTTTTEEVGVWETSGWLTDISHQGLNLVAGPRWGGSLLRTDDGLQFDDAGISLREPVGNDAGFFAFTHPGGIGIYASPDATNWQKLQAPPTWTPETEIGEDGLASGAVLVSGNDLYAFTVRGTLLGFGGVEDPVTEIWRADTSDL